MSKRPCWSVAPVWRRCQSWCTCQLCQSKRRISGRHSASHARQSPSAALCERCYTRVNFGMNKTHNYYDGWRDLIESLIKWATERIWLELKGIDPRRISQYLDVCNHLGSASRSSSNSSCWRTDRDRRRLVLSMPSLVCIAKISKSAKSAAEGYNELLTWWK